MGYLINPFVLAAGEANPVTRVTGTNSTGSGQTGNNTTTATYNITLPSAAVEGDYLVVISGSDRNSTATTPDATEIIQYIPSPAGPTVAVFYRVLSAADITAGTVGIDFTWDVAEGHSVAYCVLTGATSIYNARVVHNDAASGVTMPDLTTNDDALYAVAIALTDGSSANISMTSANGFTSLVNTQGNSGNGVPAIMLAGRELATPTVYVSPVFSNDAAEEMTIALVTLTGTTITAAEARITLQDDEEDGYEHVDDGTVISDQTTVDIGHDGDTDLIYNGFRFPLVDVPQGATITAAYIRFTAATTNSSSLTLGISAQDVDDATNRIEHLETNNISSRIRTTATTSWSPESWTTGNQFNTDSFANVVQEVVDRPGWQRNNAMCIIMERTSGTGTAQRVCTGHNGNNNPLEAPVLVVEWS